MPKSQTVVTDFKVKLGFGRSTKWHTIKQQPGNLRKYVDTRTLTPAQVKAHVTELALIAVVGGECRWPCVRSLVHLEVGVQILEAEPVREGVAVEALHELLGVEVQVHRRLGIPRHEVEDLCRSGWPRGRRHEEVEIDVFDIFGSLSQIHGYGGSLTFPLWAVLSEIVRALTYITCHDAPIGAPRVLSPALALSSGGPSAFSSTFTFPAFSYLALP